MTDVAMSFSKCLAFDDADLAANRRNELTPAQQRGPTRLLVFGSVLGLIAGGGGLLYAWASRSSNVGCGRTIGCTEGTGDPNDILAFLVIGVPSGLLGLGLFVLCVRDYRKQTAVAAQRTVSAVHVSVCDDSTEGQQPAKVLVAPGGPIAMGASVAARFETGAEYHVYHSGDIVLSFERSPT